MNQKPYRPIVYISCLLFGVCSCASFKKETLKQPDFSSIQAVIDRYEKQFSDTDLSENQEDDDVSLIPSYVYQPLQFLASTQWKPFVIDKTMNTDEAAEAPQEFSEDVIDESAYDERNYDVSDYKELIPNQDKDFFSEYSPKLNIKLDGVENKDLIASINKWLGTPYKMGGCSKKGIDCSCLVKQLYKDAYDIDLHRTSRQIFQKDVEVIDHKELKEGDIVSFKTRGGVISHIGIYLKDNKFVHASRQKGVIISDLSESYFKNRFISAGRIPLSAHDADIFALMMTPPDTKRSAHRQITIKKLVLVPKNDRTRL